MLDYGGDGKVVAIEIDGAGEVLGEFRVRADRVGSIQGGG